MADDQIPPPEQETKNPEFEQWLRERNAPKKKEEDFPYLIKGAAVGGLAGLIIGAAVGEIYVAGPRRLANKFGVNHPALYAPSAILAGFGAATGAITGGFIGAAYARYKFGK